MRVGLDGFTARITRFAQPWLVTVSIIQAVGWWIYTQQAPIDIFSGPVYALSLVTSLAFWYLLNLGRDALGAAGKAAFAATVALAVALLLVGSYKCYIEFGEFFSASMFEYAGQGGAGTFVRYIDEYLVFPLDAIFAGTLVVVSIGWYLAADLPVDRPRERARTALMACGVFIVGATGTTLLADGRHLSPDMAVITAGVRTTVVPNENHLHRTDRRDVPDLEATDTTDQPSILLVINESLGTRDLALDGNRVDQMPRLQRRIRRFPDRYTSMQRAYANSTSTDISVPSLLTGVGPYAPTTRLHEMPLAWQWARAAGLQPFYISAQNYTATSFHEFFFAGDPIPHYTPESVEGRAGEDYAADEIEIADQFDDHLADVPDDRPFFAVYNSNAMHKPFQTGSPHLDEQPDRPSDYARAQVVLDHALDRIFESLRDAGRLDETVVIMTSDHGEYPTRRHRLPRVLSVYEEFARVPMLVRLPDAWRERHPDHAEALEINRTRNVANVDIVPSIVDLLGYDDRPAADSLKDDLSGHSLFAPVPRDRTIIALNNNPIRHWEHRAFGIFWRDWRFVYSNVEGPRLFDIAEDPRQQDDRWGVAPGPVREKVRGTIDAYPDLSDIYDPDTKTAPAR
jgi:arylsulfatase A-like enzyme